MLASEHGGRDWRYPDIAIDAKDRFVLGLQYSQCIRAVANAIAGKPQNTLSEASTNGAGDLPSGSVQDVDQIEQRTPKLDVTSPNWISASDTRMRKEAAVKSLKTMRNDKAALRNSVGTFGVDKVGRRWRKESAESKTV